MYPPNRFCIWRIQVNISPILHWNIKTLNLLWLQKKKGYFLEQHKVASYWIAGKINIICISKLSILLTISMSHNINVSDGWKFMETNMRIHELCGDASVNCRTWKESSLPVVIDCGSRYRSISIVYSNALCPPTGLQVGT